jgi:hypothetical protein
MVLMLNVTALSLRLGIAMTLLLLCGCPAASQKANVPDTSEHSTKQAEGPTAVSADAKGPAPTGSSPTGRQPRKDKAEPQGAGGDLAPSLLPPYSREIPTNLGEPLVDTPNDLRRLEMASPVWVDKNRKQVVLIGTACKADYPLEFFATYPDRGYESVVVIFTQPSVVHAAMLALGRQTRKTRAVSADFCPANGHRSGD